MWMSSANEVEKQIGMNSSKQRDIIHEPVQSRMPESSDGRRSSERKVGRRPPSRHGVRPSTSRSMDSPLPQTTQHQTNPGERPSSYGNPNHKIQGSHILQRQDAVDCSDYSYGSEYSGNVGNAPFIPRPPSRPSTGAGRPKSAKGRNRASSRVGRERENSEIDEGKDPFPPPLKTQLSFSKYKPLPSIGAGNIVVSDGDPFLDDSEHRTAVSINDAADSLLQNTSSLSLQNTLPSQLPDEPDDTEPGRIHLAVKLLNGSRHERWFRHTDTLGIVLLFAESVSSVRLPPCKFLTNEMPRREFANLSVTLAQAGLSSRTVLYLEEVL